MPDLIANSISNSFQVNLSDLENRLDPHFYKPEYAELIDKLNNSPNSKLGDVVQFSSETWNQKDHFEGTFPYIEISEIDLSTGAIKYIRQVPITEAPSRAKKIVRSGDIIVSTTRPSRGAISFITDQIDFSIASTGFSVLRSIKPDAGVSLEYLFWILRQKFILRQMEQRSSGGNYPAITEDELKKVLIPTPTEDEQEEIVELFKTALANRQSRIQESENLLAEIDSYILNELGITLPEKDTSIEARMFQTTFQELSGRRFDPKLFDTHSKNLFAAVENAKYPIEPLKNLITHSAAGDWGIDEEAEVKEDQYNTCLVIRATEFDNLYNLKLENDRVRYRKIKKDKLKQLDIQPYDLLIEKSGGSPDQPVGRISLLTEELFEDSTLCYSNFIHKIRVDNSRIDPSYLFCFLKTIHNIKITEIMQSQTNGIRNLIMGEYFNQSIVLPKLDKQIEIGQEANRRRFEAQRLSIEADKVMEDARAEIEQMILE